MLLLLVRAVVGSEPFTTPVIHRFKQLTESGWVGKDGEDMPVELLEMFQLPDEQFKRKLMQLGLDESKSSDVKQMTELVDSLLAFGTILRLSWSMKK